MDYGLEAMACTPWTLDYGILPVACGLQAMAYHIDHLGMAATLRPIATLYCLRPMD